MRRNHALKALAQHMSEYRDWPIIEEDLARVVAPSGWEWVKVGHIYLLRHPRHDPIGIADFQAYVDWTRPPVAALVIFLAGIIISAAVSIYYLGL
jgi:hypothetical protein